MKKYRFFYHYNRTNNKATVHFRNKCYLTDNVKCNVPCESKFNKTQPKFVMQGFCNQIYVKENEIIMTN